LDDRQTHAVHALLKAGRPTNEIAQQFGVTQRTIQRIAKEPPIEEIDDAEARRRRAVGRPAVPQAVRTRLRDLIAADPEAPPLEFLRQLREDGTELGESTFYRVFRLEKEKLPSELMVRFEGGPASSPSSTSDRPTCGSSTDAGIESTSRPTDSSFRAGSGW